MEINKKEDENFYVDKNQFYYWKMMKFFFIEKKRKYVLRAVNINVFVLNSCYII